MAKTLNKINLKYKTQTNIIVQLIFLLKYVFKFINRSTYLRSFNQMDFNNLELLWPIFYEKAKKITNVNLKKIIKMLALWKLSFRWRKVVRHLSVQKLSLEFCTDRIFHLHRQFKKFRQKRNWNLLIDIKTNKNKTKHRLSEVKLKDILGRLSYKIFDYIKKHKWTKLKLYILFILRLFKKNLDYVSNSKDVNLNSKRYLNIFNKNCQTGIRKYKSFHRFIKKKNKAYRLYINFLFIRKNAHFYFFDKKKKNFINFTPGHMNRDLRRKILTYQAQNQYLHKCYLFLMLCLTNIFGKKRRKILNLFKRDGLIILSTSLVRLLLYKKIKKFKLGFKRKVRYILLVIFYLYRISKTTKDVDIYWHLFWKFLTNIIIYNSNSKLAYYMKRNFQVAIRVRLNLKNRFKNILKSKKRKKKLRRPLNNTVQLLKCIYLNVFLFFLNITLRFFKYIKKQKEKKKKTKTKIKNKRKVKSSTLKKKKKKTKTKIKNKRKVKLSTLKKVKNKKKNLCNNRVIKFYQKVQKRVIQGKILRIFNSSSNFKKPIFTEKKEKQKIKKMCQVQKKKKLIKDNKQLKLELLCI